MATESVPVSDPADEAWRLLTAVMMVRKEEFPALAASFGLNPGAMHALLQLDPDVPQSGRRRHSQLVLGLSPACLVCARPPVQQRAVQ